MAASASSLKYNVIALMHDTAVGLQLVQPQSLPLQPHQHLLPPPVQQPELPFGLLGDVAFVAIVHAEQVYDAENHVPPLEIAEHSGDMHRLGSKSPFSGILLPV